MKEIVKDINLSKFYMLHMHMILFCFVSYSKNYADISNIVITITKISYLKNFWETIKDTIINV